MRVKTLILLLFILTGSYGIANAQPDKHFYNIDNEVDLNGTIQKIIIQPLYKDRSPFLVITLAEKKTNKTYTVELSPTWFFEKDFHKGESLHVTGSLTAKGKQNIVMARMVKFKGEIIVLRDKHGFPNWRGSRWQKRRWQKR